MENILTAIKLFSKEITKVEYKNGLPSRIYWTKAGYKVVKSFVEKIGSYDAFMDLIGKPAVIYKIGMESIG